VAVGEPVLAAWHLSCPAWLPACRAGLPSDTVAVPSPHHGLLSSSRGSADLVRIIGAVDDHTNRVTPVHPGGAEYGLMARNNRG